MRSKPKSIAAALAVALALVAGVAASQSPAPAEGKKHPRLVSVSLSRCAVCHRKLFDGKTAGHPAAAENCTACHRVAIDETGTKVSMEAPQPALCLKCHTGLAVAATKKLPAPHAPVAESCVVCHDPHASAQAHLLRSPVPDLCLGCHDVKTLPSSHQNDATLRQSCLSCHAPHGSSSPHMVADAKSRAAAALPAVSVSASVPPPPAQPPAPVPVQRLTPDEVTVTAAATKPPPPTAPPAFAAAAPPAARPTAAPPAARPTAVAVAPAPQTVLPTVKPTAATAATVASAASAAPPGGWGQARSLLKEGRLPEAARAFRTALEARKTDFTVQFFVACSPETVRKAIFSSPGEELYVLPVRYQEKDCYQLGWGVWESEERAREASLAVPDHFTKSGIRPRIVSVPKAFR
jgi:predicted CXXCH cytochrome family protein